jgi:hypothetical protein
MTVVNRNHRARRERRQQGILTEVKKSGRKVPQKDSYASKADLRKTETSLKVSVPPPISLSIQNAFHLT